jgi:hypothetical protein
MTRLAWVSGTAADHDIEFLRQQEIDALTFAVIHYEAYADKMGLVKGAEASRRLIMRLRDIGA